MTFTVASDDARSAFTGSVGAFTAAVHELEELALLEASRCHGWSRLEVIVHVIGGWQEMLGGMVSVTDDDPTVDAASYWPAFTDDTAGSDPVAVLTAQRRRAAAYARPASAVAHLDDVAAAVLRGAAAMDDRRRRWQGHVFTAGDFLAVWAVEDAVHHLDLAAPRPPDPGALRLARAGIEALLGEPLPAAWDDARAVLVGTGRVAVPDEAAALRARLPALG